MNPMINRAGGGYNPFKPGNLIYDKTDGKNQDDFSDKSVQYHCLKGDIIYYSCCQANSFNRPMLFEWVSVDDNRYIKSMYLKQSHGSNNTSNEFRIFIAPSNGLARIDGTSTSVHGGNYTSWRLQVFRK